MRDRAELPRQEITLVAPLGFHLGQNTLEGGCNCPAVAAWRADSPENSRAKNFLALGQFQLNAPVLGAGLGAIA